MAFILILLILLILGGSGFFFLKSYDEKYVALQKSNMLLKSQVLKLQEKCSLIDSSPKDCSLEFLTVDNHYGILPKNTIIRLSPLSDSLIVKKITDTVQVNILEKVIINNCIWYYISLPIEDNFNSRGWVEESAFSEFTDSSLEISEN